MTNHPDNRRHTFQMFFDGACPLCAREISLLAKWDTRKVIHFIDLNDTVQMRAFPSIEMNDAMASLYVKISDGEVFRGVDATYVIWESVGKGRWVKPLTWKWFRPIALAAYAVFARHRHTIALILTGKSRLENERSDHCIDCSQAIDLNPQSSEQSEPQKTQGSLK
ncbi:thiol-disulfide oxidoreductase DCC family protein [Aurantivibrio plasticivorans]